MSFGARDRVSSQKARALETRGATFTHCARRATFERQASLMSTASWKERHGFGTTVLFRQVLRQPIADIALQPADAAAVETLSSRKLAKHGHAEQPPSRPASKPRDIVSAQEMFPGREALIHPSRKSNVPKRSGRGRALCRREILRAHKRPSCVVPVV